MQNRLETQLLAELSRRNIDLITQWAEENHSVTDKLVQIVLQHKETLAPRAAWVLEKLSEKQFNYLENDLINIIKELRQIPSSSTRRAIAKVLIFHDIPEDFESEVLDFCLSMIESPKEPVAVKANCMSVLFNLLPKYPELKNEIFVIIEDQIPHNSVGFKGRFNGLKRKLK